MANRNLRKGTGDSNHKSRKQALDNWDKFKREHPGEDAEKRKTD